MCKDIFKESVLAHVCFVVKDIEKTSQMYADFFGIENPDWFWTGEYEKELTEYRNNPTPARAKLAFFNLGSLQIELIEPDEGPSIWREFLEKNGEGFHHIGINVKDMEGKIKVLEQNAMPVLQKGGNPSAGHYSYIDTIDNLKTMFELLEGY